MNEENKFTCKSCGSESTGSAGECCGGNRDKVCASCDHAHEGKGCDCGCEMS